MRNHWVALFFTCRVFGVLLLFMVAGCTGTTPTADPGGPLLTGPDQLPKQLATVELSPTPPQQEQLATVIAATLDSRLPTSTSIPASPTPTTTPYIGTFLGNATFQSGNALIRVRVRSQGTPGLTPLPGTAIATAGTVKPATPIPFIVTEANPGVPPINTVPGQVALPTAIASLPACAVQPAAEFVGASGNPLVRQQIGCPTGQPFGLTLVVQPFERGLMFWRDTKQIYALSTAQIQVQATVDTLWIIPDQWNETLPADDPGLQPPGGLLQPIRGFGYAWRSNPPIRDALGWATQPEMPVGAVWQDFERGWMMTGPGGVAYALIPGNPTGVHFGPLR